MNEVKHIHLGRQQFTVSVAAYKTLHDYLEAIKEQVGDKSADVVDEVEMRMAELLTERGINESKVVLPKDVKFLKDQLGEPKDFADDEKDTGSANDETVPKQFYRDTDNAMIAGVASGLGAYLGVDATIIRLIFVLLVFAGGSGILIYILMWLIVPEAKTASDKLSMQGKPVTVESLKAVVKQADVPAAARRANNTFGHVFRLFAQIVLIATGVSLIVGGIGLFTAGVTALMYGLVHGAYVAGVKLFPVGGEQVAILVCGVVAASLVATMLILLGVTIARRKRTVVGWVWAVLLGLTMVASSVASGLSFDVGAKIRTQYLALQHTKTVPVNSFQTLNFVSDKVFYDVQSGPTDEVLIKTLGNVDTSQIQISEQGGVLKIDTTKFHPATTCNFICPYGETNTTIIVQTTGDVSNLMPTDPFPRKIFIAPRQY